VAVELLRWTQPEGGAVPTEFRAHAGTTKGPPWAVNYSLGLPEPDGDGIYTGSINLPGEAWIGLTSANEFGESELSNLRFVPEPGSASLIRCGILLLLLLARFRR